VALSDALRMLAHPDRTLARRGVRKDVEVILGLIADEKVEAVVVGLPYELDGSEGRSARLARQIGEAIAAEDVPVTYIDERYSSVEAEERLLEADVSRDRRKQVIDQAAAVVILQSFLDHGDWTKDAKSG
jgi:putative Holliday junction resolvase